MAQLNSVLPANVARTNFYKILEEVDKYWRQFTITHRGKPVVAVMSAEELESWKETLEITSDKKLMQSIRKARKELKAGKGIPAEKVNKILGW